ncbi:Hypothetical protein Minf_0264 [Methylacidiphilum infernorum V4]|uniref:Uncharacterized protein n=1 Tax=Methylacidiphilum infernorum (isolate V4) TaxID=481448 RepID=B3DY47_METI4|nr:Hypothetical protein Minf_0264 [Methylacidiphilum infernorum V4]
MKGILEVSKNKQNKEILYYLYSRLYCFLSKSKSGSIFHETSLFILIFIDNFHLLFCRLFSATSIPQS